MKSIKLISFLTLLLLFISCGGQTKPIGEQPLDLSHFNFDTKITVFYPNKNKSKDYKGYYAITTKYNSQLVEKDTTFIDEYSDHKKAMGIEYRQQSSSNIDTLAVFEKQIFNKINVATTLDNKVKVICAVADEMSITESQSFIKTLSDKYGKCKKSESEFFGKYFIYEWQTNNAIIKYSSVFNNESTTLKIIVDKTKNTIKQGNNEPHFEGYFYLIKKEYIGGIENLKTGDFVFIN
jgi:hypothetical protein